MFYYKKAKKNVKKIKEKIPPVFKKIPPVFLLKKKIPPVFDSTGFIWRKNTLHHSAEQGRETPGECPVTPFGLDVGPVTWCGVTVFIHIRFLDHVNFD